MLLQTIMPLLRAEGLDSCVQECWALYPRTIPEFLNLPPVRRWTRSRSSSASDETLDTSRFLPRRQAGQWRRGGAPRETLARKAL